MKYSSNSFTLLAATSLLSCASAALDPIVIKGSKFFFKSNGTQFFIKGVAYQQGVAAGGAASSTNTQYSDPLADANACQRDIPYLQQLGTNVIRTYAIDPTQDHSKCMSLLDAAGIYLISDLSEPSLSIDRETPAWDTTLYDRYTAVVDSLQSYSNVIGFFAGNEVTSNTSYTQASAFVKAAVRDTKAYIKSKGYRTMGVGYAADDDAFVRTNVANYFNCDKVENSIDFWGYNIYSWCGNSDYVTSGYINRTQEFSSYSVPVFFAEYGCNTQGGGAAGRKFTEVGTLFGDQMSQVFSGGIVYEYFQEQNDYGLVTAAASSVSTLADFNALSTQIASVTMTGTNSASYSPTNTALQACPTLDASWQASTSLPPTPNDAVCSCMVASLSCTAKSSLSATDISTLFGLVCGYNSGKPCNGIAANASSGTYGQYSYCNATAKLSYAFDQYYKSQSSASSACDFGSKAQVVKPAAAASSCSNLPSSGSGSGSGGSSTNGAPASASSTKSAANALGAPMPFSMSGFSVGFSVLAMFLTGAGMILL